ncbi:MAG: hypothetical protein ACRD1R_13320 [Acidobacteriota bacterium]
MARKGKTTKQLAKRIDINYFKRLHPFRRKKRYASYVALALAAAWLIASALVGDEGVFNPGPVSRPHAFIEEDCSFCHTGAEENRFLHPVTDGACQSCHAGPLHHRNQVFAGHTGSQPSCGSCHQEHQGRSADLVFMQDKNCLQCHRSLQVDETLVAASSPDLPEFLARPPQGYARAISSFESDHPEFRFIRDQMEDPAQIKLNHQVHLRPDLPAPEGPVQLECQSCHRIDAQGAYMEPVNFERDCQSCHPLAFDERIFEEAPHEDPEFAEAFVRTAFSKYAGEHPDEWRRPSDWHPARNLSSLRRMVEEAPRDLPDWLEREVGKARQLLFSQKCQECHVMQDLQQEVPAVVQPRIPDRFLGHSRFDHQAHRMLECSSCHEQALQSSRTEDILIPGREDCLHCHNTSTGAPAECVTCHAYHSQTKNYQPGRLRINDIVGGSQQGESRE